MFATFAIAILAGVRIVGAAQQTLAGFIDPMPTARLKQLFPNAAGFTPRGTVDPLYFTAYTVDPRTPGAGTPSGRSISCPGRWAITATFT